MGEIKQWHSNKIVKVKNAQKWIQWRSTKSIFVGDNIILLKWCLSYLKSLLNIYYDGLIIQNQNLIIWGLGLRVKNKKCYWD